MRKIKPAGFRLLHKNKHIGQFLFRSAVTISIKNPAAVLIYHIFENNEKLIKCKWQYLLLKRNVAIHRYT